MKLPYPVPEAPGPPCSQMTSGSWKMLCPLHPVQGSNILREDLMLPPSLHDSCCVEEVTSAARGA